MNEFFPQKAYLPYLPSAFAPNGANADQVETPIEQEKALLCQEYSSVFSWSELNSDPGKITLALLDRLANQVVQRGATIPFQLSADSLEADVLRCDALGPASQFNYYQTTLRYECRWLVSRHFNESDILAMRDVIFKWKNNRCFFKCSVIGAVLLIKFHHFKKRWGNEE